ncbi:hypothetical protein RSOCI_01730 [Rhabdochlamydiaceae symbiont of Dictyostelium giganteum]
MDGGYFLPNFNQKAQLEFLLQKQPALYGWRNAYSKSLQKTTLTLFKDYELSCLIYLFKGSYRESLNLTRHSSSFIQDRGKKLLTFQDQILKNSRFFTRKVKKSSTLWGDDSNRDMRDSFKFPIALNPRTCICS